jgi:glucose/arabinose dehydrogenase
MRVLVPLLLALRLAAASAAPIVFSDYRGQKPGVMHHIRVSDLPPPYATNSAGNPPQIVDRPKGAWPQVPPGFKVEQFVTGLDNPRLLRTAPNGDVFVAESGPGRIIIFRGVDKAGHPGSRHTFASKLDMPFGIAFYPPGPAPHWLYVANTNAVVRFAYHDGDVEARGKPEKVLGLPTGGHWTRDVAFSRDGKQMFVSVGSSSNADDVDSHPNEERRADILLATPEGKHVRIYASGIRNAVGIAIQPGTGVLWCSTNERDGLGDNLPPDYITHVQPNGFYGWPWFYIGDHPDPRHEGKHTELAARVIEPDVLLQPHNASLQMTFYEGRQFPANYRGDIFAAQHGSWNRSVRTGYELIRVPLKNGKATGEYEDFMTGFVTPQGNAWGRPVGVTVAPDGSLLVTDDAGGCIWRIVHL